MGVAIVVAVAMLAVGVGIVGLVSPARQAAFVTRQESPAGLWASAGIRLVFGAALWLVAPTARTPLVLQVLAVLAVVVALLLPFLGVARFTALLSGWTRQPPAFRRVWSAMAVGFGGFVLWSVLV